MRVTDTTSADFFEEKYSASPDPWNFASDAYEQQRYDTIVRSLAGRRFARAWEPGCSIGVLTERLASFCDRVDACDLSPSAVQQAQVRCSVWPGVRVRCASLKDEVPTAAYDLIVLSEVGYYLSAGEWAGFLRKTIDAMQPGAWLLASHWLGTSPDHILTGDAVHEALNDHALLRRKHSERHEDPQHGGFRLDVWERKTEESA